MSLASRASRLRLAWPPAERGRIFLRRVNPRRKTLPATLRCFTDSRCLTCLCQKGGKPRHGRSGCGGAHSGKGSRDGGKHPGPRPGPAEALSHPIVASSRCSCLFQPNPGPASPIPSTAEARSVLGGGHPIITRAWGTQRQGWHLCPRNPGGCGENRPSSNHGRLCPAEGSERAWGSGWDPRARLTPPGGTPKI